MKGKTLLFPLYVYFILVVVVGVGCFVWHYFIKNEDMPVEQITEVSEEDDLIEIYIVPVDIFDEYGFIKDIVAKDIVGLFPYMNIYIPFDKYFVSEEILEEEIANLLAAYIDDEAVLDQIIQYGDSVNIDFIGYIDGEEFQGGSTEGLGFNVIAGADNFVGEFLDKIIGLTSGDTIEIVETFPEDYWVANLAGLEAAFITTVNHINKKPELTEEVVLEFLQEPYGWETVGETIVGVTILITDFLVYEYIMELVSEYMMNNVDYDLFPDFLLEYHEHHMIDYFINQAEASNLGIDEFLLMQIGVSSLDELKIAYRDYNLNTIAYTLVLQAVADDYGLPLLTKRYPNLIHLMLAWTI